MVAALSQRQSFSNRAGLVAGVPDGVLNVAVSEVILDEPCIRSLIGKGEAAGVAQHVGMREQGQGRGGTAVPSFQKGKVDRLKVQRRPLLADERMSCRMGFIRGRVVFSHGADGPRYSSSHKGCVVFVIATRLTRL